MPSKNPNCEISKQLIMSVLLNKEDSIDIDSKAYEESSGGESHHY